MLGLLVLILIALVVSVSVDGMKRCKRVLADSRTAHDSLLVYGANTDCR